VPQINEALRLTCVWMVALSVPCASTAQTAALHIKIISGENTIYSAGAHVAKPLTIEVTDGTGRPVEGAKTSFQLPEEGPGGVFPNGLRTDLATTDPSGRATLRGLQLNRLSGPFNIRVTAAKEQARAGIVVRQQIGDATAVAEVAVERQPVAENPQRTSVVEPAKATPVPVEAAPATAKPATIATPRAVATGTDTGSKRVSDPVPGASASRPARVQTIVITQKSKSTSGPSASSGHRSHKKWVWLGLLVAGGAAGAFAGQNLGAAAAAHGAPAPAATAASVSIGAPSITLGKP